MYLQYVPMFMFLVSTYSIAKLRTFKMSDKKRWCSEAQLRRMDYDCCNRISNINGNKNKPQINVNGLNLLQKHNTRVPHLELRSCVSIANAMD